MAKFIKKMSGKAGLPPGTLLHIGERKTEETRIRLIKYSLGKDPAPSDV